MKENLIDEDAILIGKLASHEDELATEKKLEINKATPAQSENVLKDMTDPNVASDRSPPTIEHLEVREKPG